MNLEYKTFSNPPPSQHILSFGGVCTKAKGLKWNSSLSLLPFRDISIEISYGKLPLITAFSFIIPKLTVKSLKFSLAGEITQCWLKAYSKEEINGGALQINMMKLTSYGLRSKSIKFSISKKTISPGTSRKWVKISKPWTNKHSFMISITNSWMTRTSCYGINISPSIEG